MNEWNSTVRVLLSRAVTGAAAAALCLGCGGGGGGGSGESSHSSARGADSTTVLTSVDVVSDGNGVASASFELPSGTNKAALTASTDAFIGTDLVVSDTGAVYANYEGEITTLSTSIDTFVSTVNAPSRDFDPPLSAGTLSMQTTVASGSDEAGNIAVAAGRPVNFSVLGKADPDLSSGAVTVNIVFIGPAAQDGVKAAMQQAIGVFSGIYAGEAGIEPVISQFDFGGPGVLPDPSTGDALYLAISAAVPAPGVNVCVGLDLSTSDLLGLSSGIPGPPLPTVKSCVGVSAINAAGGDGAYSEEDIRVLGETLAHEIGHYMGLFHPVEGDFASFDPLTDTPLCSGAGNCDAVLGSNNMYYSPIAGAGGALIPQSQFTPQQRGVLNRYAAVD